MVLCKQARRFVLEMPEAWAGFGETLRHAPLEAAVGILGVLLDGHVA